MNNNNEEVYIYTDGACKGNPGIGGWGAVLRYKNFEKHLFGYQLSTTNNQMELTAVIEALNILKRSCKVILTTDSQYVKNGITLWLNSWKNNNWKNNNKQAIKNVELWKKLDNLLQAHQITCKWVKGHAGHPENELADQLANRAINEHQ